MIISTSDFYKFKDFKLSVKKKKLLFLKKKKQENPKPLKNTISKMFKKNKIQNLEKM